MRTILARPFRPTARSLNLELLENRECPTLGLAALSGTSLVPVVTSPQPALQHITSPVAPSQVPAPNSLLGILFPSLPGGVRGAVATVVAKIPSAPDQRVPPPPGDIPAPGGILPGPGLSGVGEMLGDSPPLPGGTDAMPQPQELDVVFAGTNTPLASPAVEAELLWVNRAVELPGDALTPSPVSGEKGDKGAAAGAAQPRMVEGSVPDVPAEVESELETPGNPSTPANHLPQPLGPLSDFFPLAPWRWSETIVDSFGALEQLGGGLNLYLFALAATAVATAAEVNRRLHPGLPEEAMPADGPELL